MMNPEDFKACFADFTPLRSTPDPELIPSVVFMLFHDPGQWKILAIQKTNTRGYPWANQVALPGGHVDPDDSSQLAAAFRELEEETGIVPDEVDVYGSFGFFSTLKHRKQTDPAGFVPPPGWIGRDMEVFAGHWKHPRTLSLHSMEIARFLFLSVGDLMNTHRSRFAGRLPDVSELSYPVENTCVWGATARILHSVLEHLNDRGICDFS